MSNLHEKYFTTSHTDRRPCFRGSRENILSRSDPHACGEIRYIRDSRCLSGNDINAVCIFFTISSRSREGEAWDIMQLGYGGINISLSLLARSSHPPQQGATADGPFLDRAILDDKQFRIWVTTTIASLYCYRSLRKRRQRNRDTISLCSAWYPWWNPQNSSVFRTPILFLDR